MFEGIGDFFRDLFGLPDPGIFEQQAQEQATRARAASQEALEAQRLATRRAEYAALPALDKPSTMAASDEQIRKLLAAMNINFTGGSLGSSMGGLNIGSQKLSGY